MTIKEMLERHKTYVIEMYVAYDRESDQDSDALSPDQALADIKKLIEDEVIGKDETMAYGEDGSESPENINRSRRNNFKAHQRQALDKLIGDKQ